MNGAWITHAHREVSTHGDVQAFGDLPTMPLQGRITAATLTTSERGYWLLGEDGGRSRFVFDSSG